MATFLNWALLVNHQQKFAHYPEKVKNRAIDFENFQNYSSYFSHQHAVFSKFNTKLVCYEATKQSVLLL